MNSKVNSEMNSKVNSESGMQIYLEKSQEFVNLIRSGKNFKDAQSHLLMYILLLPPESKETLAKLFEAIRDDMVRAVRENIGYFSDDGSFNYHPGMEKY